MVIAYDTGFADDAVAGDQIRERVLADGGAHGAGGVGGFVNGVGETAVGGERAGFNPQ